MTDADAASLTGRWVGGYDVAGGWRFLLLDLEAAAASGELEGRADVLFETDTRADDVSATGSHVSFTLRRDTEILRFEGVREAGVIEGIVASATWRGKLLLLHTPPLSDPRRYCGTYQLADGRLVAIVSVGGFYIPDALSMTEIPSGDVRFLFPAADDSLVAGPGLLVPLPVERRFEFRHLSDGRFQHVRVRDVSGDQIEGTRLKMREEEIRFRNGDVTLVGTLVLPSGTGPYPAVVIAHGSGDAVRDDPFAHVLAQRGFAFFRYDKRGVGASTGDWHTASFEDLADDVVAALDCIAKRSDIDASRMGIWGWSQGGWIAPLAASRTTGVAFLVLQVPPAVSPAEQEIDRVENELRVDGFASSEISEAVEFMRRKSAFAKTGKGWPEFAALLEHSAKSRWFPYAGSPMQEDSWGWTFFRLINDHDPIPVLERIQCRVLALFGELDRNVVPAVSAPLLQAALSRAGNRQVTVKVFRNANHGLFECRVGGPKELPMLRRYVPDYLGTLIEWLGEVASGRPA